MPKLQIYLFRSGTSYWMEIANDDNRRFKISKDAFGKLMVGWRPEYIGINEQGWDAWKLPLDKFQFFT